MILHWSLLGIFFTVTLTHRGQDAGSAAEQHLRGWYGFFLLDTLPRPTLTNTLWALTTRPPCKYCKCYISRRLVQKLSSWRKKKTWQWREKMTVWAVWFKWLVVEKGEFLFSKIDTRAKWGLITVASGINKYNNWRKGNRWAFPHVSLLELVTSTLAWHTAR